MAKVSNRFSWVTRFALDLENESKMCFIHKNFRFCLIRLPPCLTSCFLSCFSQRWSALAFSKTGLFCAEKHPHYYKFNMLTFSRSIVHLCASFRLDDATTMSQINFLVICSLWIIIVQKIAISRDCNLHKVSTLMLEIVISKFYQRFKINDTF